MFPCLHLYKAVSSVLPLVLTAPSPNHSWQVAVLLYVLPVLEGVYLIDWCWDYREGERLRDFHLHPSHTSQSRYLPFSVFPLLSPSRPMGAGTLMHPSVGPMTVSCCLWAVTLGRTFLGTPPCLSSKSFLPQPHQELEHWASSPKDPSS